jgi:outer membrane protein X
MKKSLFILFICITFVCNLYAQDQQGVLSFAGNLSYGTKIESLGLGVRAQYGLTENVRVSTEYKYYIDRHNLSAWGIALDAHYVFNASESVALYPIGGVTVSRWTLDSGRSKLDGITHFKRSHNRPGINLGFGTQVEVAYNTFIQIEAKEALIKDYTQFVFSVGIMYQF